MLIKNVVTLITTLLLMTCSLNAWSFSCKTATGEQIPVGGGTARVNVSLTPQVTAGQALVVDLSTQIFCSNSVSWYIIDYASLLTGGSFQGGLANFKGTVKYDGRWYPFPIENETHKIIFDSAEVKPWPTQLYLTPLSGSRGVVIKSGTHIATLVLHQTNNFNGDNFIYMWHIDANNDVVMQTGGCDVSTRDVTVMLPDYPGSKNVPLSVSCTQRQKLSFYLSGKTSNADNSIFDNTASGTKAQGVGIQLTRNGSPITAHSNVSLGYVDSTPVNLNLNATYAPTGGQITQGQVQSVIGLAFVYD